MKISNSNKTRSASDESSVGASTVAPVKVPLFSGFIDEFQSSYLKQQNLSRARAYSAHVHVEHEFLQAKTFVNYMKLVSQFSNSYREISSPQYRFIDSILIKPSQNNASSPAFNNEKDLKMERWNEHHLLKYAKLLNETLAHAQKRESEIREHGKGIGGKMTPIVEKAKAASYFTKNRLTIRGNVFRLGDEIFGKTIYETQPRYGKHKAFHITTRICQFTANITVVALGHALIPFTFGVSKIVSDHASTVVVLTGEFLTNVAMGKSKEKVMFHAGLRGLQLEIPRMVPVIGDIVSYGEQAVFGVAALGIVTTTVADLVLQATSDRYTSRLNLDELGDSKCLFEMGQRIDYLSRFLLPHGQYLLLKEVDVDKREALKGVLKKKFKLMRKLEKLRIKATNYYQLALVGDRLPEKVREKVRSDCEAALTHERINSHRVVRQCLATLLSQDKADPKSLIL